MVGAGNRQEGAFVFAPGFYLSSAVLCPAQREQQGCYRDAKQAIVLAICLEGISRT